MDTNHDPFSFATFQSQTYGALAISDVADRIMAYVAASPDSEYELIIGSDSTLNQNHSADFVSAIVIHRKRQGGIYFWTKRREGNIYTLRQRMFQEAFDSIRLAERLLVHLKAKNAADFQLSIHVDVGPNGETKKMLQEIVGMVKGSGYVVKTKPYSYGASSVADRHT